MRVFYYKNFLGVVAEIKGKSMFNVGHWTRKDFALYINENYKELMNELSMTENLIAEYRSNYNKQIKEYNRYVKKFPTRYFLNILGYEGQEYEYLDYHAPIDAPQNLFSED